jgi:hypothetical protein
MGQGRHIQLPLRGILLIAMAIQGITPDTDDLASNRAITVLLPILNDDQSPCDEVDSPDDVCELVQLDPVRQLLSKAEEGFYLGLSALPASGQDLRCGAALRAFLCGGALQPPLRIEALCRMIC